MTLDDDEARDSPAADGLPVTADGHLGSAKAHEAYHALRQGIDDGRYPAGTRLKEVELARQLGMSRTPIREAFRQLQRDGAITILPNRGAAVRALETEELDDIYALRAVLEGFCASRAATRMDEPAIAQLAAVNAEFERRVRDPDGDIDVLIRLNDVFHGMIVEGSRNERVGDVLQQTIVVPMTVRRGFWTSAHAREMASVYHREIVEAIRSRDAIRAEAVMRSHVYAVKDDYQRRQRAAGIRDLVNRSTP
jgi:DNA-binding GntR family transcriptional regulator